MSKNKKKNLIGIVIILVFVWIVLHDTAAKSRLSVIACVNRYAEIHRTLPLNATDLASASAGTTQLMDGISGFWPEIKCQSVNDEEVKIRQTFSKLFFFRWTFVDKVKLVTADGAPVRLK
jgi:hypothetical protein